MNPRKLILTLPYRVYRTPLAVLDARIGRRLPDDAPPVLVLDRALGAYDRFAGRLLRDPSVERQGVERLERTRRLVEAIELEQEADARRAAADRIAEEGEREAERRAQQAEERLAEGLDEAEQTERRGKQAAAQRARNTAAQRKQAAETRATQRVKAAEQEVERTEAVATARTKRAQSTAKAELDDASKQRASARAKRQDAERLDDLVETKKATRARS